VHKDLIYTIENSLSKVFCKHVINKFEAEPNKQPGRVSGNAPRVDKSVKDTTDFGVTTSSNWIEEDKIFYDALQKGLKEYNNHLLNIHKKLMPDNNYKMQDTGYKIQKYEPNGYYNWHNDWCMTKQGSRVFVFMWYLNTLKIEHEGYTEFLDGTKLQPTCGNLILFPATWTYVHRGYKPKISKYLCNGWIYAKP
tara:strand:- start:911 stop:1492 length:582 start_codon:yes stop_codon:yes gene_type:complete